MSSTLFNLKRVQTTRTVCISLGILSQKLKLILLTTVTLDTEEFLTTHFVTTKGLVQAVSHMYTYTFHP